MLQCSVFIAKSWNASERDPAGGSIRSMPAEAQRRATYARGVRGCRWACGDDGRAIRAARVTMKFTNQEFAHILAALQAEERATDAADRRRHSRIDIGIVIQVVDAATKRSYSAMTRDISFTGISIVQSAMPTLNSYVIIQLPRRRQKFDAVRCQVMHVRDLADGLFCIGCAFVAIEAPAANKPETPQAPAA